MSPIHTDPDILGGKPCFAGTRVPVKALFDLLEHNRTIEYFLESFPTVRREQVIELLEMASKRYGASSDAAA